MTRPASKTFLKALESSRARPSHSVVVKVLHANGGLTAMCGRAVKNSAAITDNLTAFRAADNRCTPPRTIARRKAP